MTTVMYVLGVLAVAVGIGLSIALHEIGHLVPAKLFGVKVTRYMIGFGPTLWARKYGETEYGVKAIPLGGFVSMVGMLPPKAGDAPGMLRASSTNRWTAMMDDARAQSMEEIEPGDEDRVFYKLASWKKIIVMVSGPLMNLVIAAVLITGLLTLYGVMDGTAKGAKVASVVECVAADSAQSTTCTDGATQGPAYAAGLRAGDQIVSINGRAITTSTDIAAAVRPNAGKAISVAVLRGDQPLTFTITPITRALPTYDAATGEVILDASGKAVTESVGYLGTSTRPIYAIVPQPISAVPTFLGNAVSQTASVVVQLPAKMVGVVEALVSDGERDPNGPSSVVGVGRAAGEKAGGEVTGSILDDIAVAPFIVQLLAGLNIALFVFNLIPLMPLDGGQIAGAVWEWLKRSFAKVTGRPDPGYVDVAKGLPLAYAVASIMIVMTVVLMWADIVKPVRY